jgi:hypothetical protein
LESFLIFRRSAIIKSLPSSIAWSIGAKGKVYDGQLLSLDQSVNLWPSGNLTCPPKSNCGVVITIPMWNISGSQTLLLNCTIPPAIQTSNYQKVYGLAYLDTTGPPYGTLDGSACPGRSSPQYPGSYVCYLPSTPEKLNTSIPNCPTGPYYNASNPSRIPQ